MAGRYLKTTNVVRLGLTLNYAIYNHEILNQSKYALTIAKEAFDLAVSNLDDLDETEFNEVSEIMQLLRDNLTVWQTETGESTNPDPLQETAAQLLADGGID